MQRSPRSLLRRLVSRADYYCESCDKVMGTGRHYFSIFHRYCECPRCGTRKLSRLSRRDHIEKTSRNPLRWILGLVGTPLYHCVYCRFQFRDWRKRHPEAIPRPSV